MDWTGGARRRCAQTGKNNEFRAKQKAHCVKARALATRSPGSIIPDFIREAVGHKRSSTSRQRHSAHDHDLGSARSSTFTARRPHQHVVASGKRVDDAQQHSASTARDMTYHDISLHGVSGTKSAAPADLTAEQCRLKAIRQRLLARTDWLGLSASRPLKLKFPADRDKERVGKRRKIERPRHRDVNKLLQRRVTPPFQHRERLIEPMMSGALMNDEIKVKIGTDAFASQTQRSRNSTTPVNTSVRPPSADLASISEQSMLLREEDGDFLANDDMLSLIHYDDDLERHADSSEPRSAQADQLTFNDHLSATWVLQQWPSMQTSQHDLTSRTRPYVPVAPALRAATEALDTELEPNQTVETHGRCTSDQEIQCPESDQAPQNPVAYRLCSPVCSAETILARPDGDDDDTGLWQQPVNTNIRPTNIATTSALKPPSISQMQPDTGSILLAMLGKHSSRSPFYTPPPQVDLARPCLIDHSIEPADAVKAAQSTQHMQGTSGQTHGSQTTDTDDNDNEKWRQFMFGSRYSKGGSSSYSDRQSMGAKDQHKPGIPTFDNVASDQPQSDRATIGQATAAAYLSTDPLTTISTDEHVENTSHIGHAAATTLSDVDDIEDDHIPEVKPKAKRKPDASRQIPFTARFRQSKRSQPGPLPKANRFLPATSVRAVAHTRSVYDLSSNGE